MATTKKAAAKTTAAKKAPASRSIAKAKTDTTPPEDGMVWSERFNQWVPEGSMRARES